ncbi:hypothetical protein FJY68_04710 [candidate division WOR-3 bacterium]|uniref:Uncharacterized protein n=1 Tax=candidate division WOR-3 bacterium TaxID=2052148 RepID=A0A938BQZ6_UNCW3|nr:hypothetical protein [candidate division WOR-3 bacterium]
MKSDKKSETALSHRKVGLSKAARDLLARVRASPSPVAVYGLPPDAAEAKARSVINPLIEETGLPVARLNQYRWFLAELCRLMRTRSGPDLAYCMENTLKKWLGFGLEPNSVVVLATELYDRLKPETRNPEHGTTDEHGWTQIPVEPRKHEEHEGEPGTGTLESADPGTRTRTSADDADYTDSPARALEPSTPGTLPPGPTSGGGGP